MPAFVTSNVRKSNGVHDPDEFERSATFFCDPGIVCDVRGLLPMLEVRSWKMSER